MLQKHEILLEYPWMDEQFFERIIKQDLPNANTVEVKKFNVDVALPPGENYGSQMIRATVEYKIDGEYVSKRFIIKTMFIEKELKEMLADLNVFEKEIRMFREIIPELEKILANVGDNTKFAAKCYASSEVDQYIVFEDLTVREYRNVNKRLGLDVNQYKTAITKIAKYHACAAMLYEKGYPFTNMTEPLVSTDICKQMAASTLKGMAEAVKQIPNYRHLSDKLYRLVDNIVAKTDVALKFKETDFVTLCHGDLWMNNIMFKFDDLNSPVDAILVDYQVPYVGPATLDLINTLFTSSRPSLRDRHWDVLVQHYHGVLSETLTKLNYPKPIPTLTSIQMQVLEKGICYVPLSVLSSGLRTAQNPTEDVVSMMDPEAMKKLIASDSARESIEFLLDYFDRKGYFE